MKTVEIEIYKFNELSDEAKQTAIEQYRKRQNEFGEYLYFFDDSCEERAKEKGFEDIELCYSLGYCQGDGLSFSANYTKLSKLYLNYLGKGKDKTAQFLADNTWLKIEHNKGHYCYCSENDVELYVDLSYQGNNVDNITEIEGQVLSDLQEIYTDLCAEFEENGYAEIEYQNSDEAITETIEANEYEFNKDGEQY